MENKLTPELLEKAKQAKSAEELIALAKENGAEMTAEEANAYFAKLNPQSGELSDDELDNVAGGGCVQETVDTVCNTARDALDTARDAMSFGSGDRFGISEQIADQVADVMRQFNEGSGTAIGSNTETGTNAGTGTGLKCGVIKK